MINCAHPSHFSNVVEGELDFPQSSYDSGTRNESYNGGVPYTGHVDSADNLGLFTFSGWTPGRIAFTGFAPMPQK